MNSTIMVIFIEQLTQWHCVTRAWVLDVHQQLLPLYALLCLTVLQRLCGFPDTRGKSQDIFDSRDSRRGCLLL